MNTYHSSYNKSSVKTQQWSKSCFTALLYIIQSRSEPVLSEMVLKDPSGSSFVWSSFFFPLPGAATSPLSVLSLHAGCRFRTAGAFRPRPHCQHGGQCSERSKRAAGERRPLQVGVESHREYDAVYNDNSQN